MTDAFWNNLGGIITAIVLGIPIVWTLLKVNKVETHTNSMVAKLERAAKQEGKAEVLDTLAAATPAIPLAITPVTNDPKVLEWIKVGIEIEKARRAAEGDGPTHP